MAEGIPAKPVRKVERRKPAGYGTEWNIKRGVSTSKPNGTDTPSPVVPDAGSPSVGTVQQPAADPIAAFKQENLPEGGNTWDYIVLIEGVGNTDEAKDAGRRTAQALYDIGHTVKTVHITSRTRGVEHIRIERRD